MESGNLPKTASFELAKKGGEYFKKVEVLEGIIRSYEGLFAQKAEVTLKEFGWDAAGKKAARKTAYKRLKALHMGDLQSDNDE